VYIMDIIWSDR